MLKWLLGSQRPVVVWMDTTFHLTVLLLRTQGDLVVVPVGWVGPKLIRVNDNSKGTSRHEGHGLKENLRPGPSHDVPVDQVEDLRDEVDTGRSPM